MSGKKRHLGRGLDALLGAAAQAQPAGAEPAPGTGPAHSDNLLKELAGRLRAADAQLRH